MSGFHGFVVSMVLWFHRFCVVDGFMVFVCFWFHRFRGVNVIMVS